MNIITWIAVIATLAPSSRASLSDDRAILEARHSTGNQATTRSHRSNTSQSRAIKEEWGNMLVSIGPLHDHLGALYAIYSQIHAELVVARRCPEALTPEIMLSNCAWVQTQLFYLYVIHDCDLPELSLVKEQSEILHSLLCQQEQKVSSAVMVRPIVIPSSSDFQLPASEDLDIGSSTILLDLIEETSPTVETLLYQKLRLELAFAWALDDRKTDEMIRLTPMLTQVYDHLDEVTKNVAHGVNGRTHRGMAVWIKYARFAIVYSQHICQFTAWRNEAGRPPQDLAKGCRIFDKAHMRHRAQRDFLAENVPQRTLRGFIFGTFDVNLSEMLIESRHDRFQFTRQ